jgi:hypothetical protein
MLKELETALLNLDTAFYSSKPDNVLVKADFLRKEIELIKDRTAITIDNKELNRTTKLIEKLSIHNEFKLNLLKEFSSYSTNKK